MSDHDLVPDPIAIPIINDLFDRARKVLGKPVDDVTLEEYEVAARGVADTYNGDQTAYDADVRVLRGECDCGQCYGIGFRLSYRTYH